MYHSTVSGMNFDYWFHQLATHYIDEKSQDETCIQHATWQECITIVSNLYHSA